MERIITRNIGAGGSHSTVFHTVTLHSTSLSIKTLHQLEPSETFLKVTHLIITQSQTRLTMKFLSNVLLKSICILLIYVVSINSFKSSSIVQSSYLHNLWIPLILVCYMPISFLLVPSQIPPYWERGLF
ncbi:hypothetical protein GmHk_12G034398 [Glycine max]|nr:hypothetical protein GmHk_12G034398 [Glycine max]